MDNNVNELNFTNEEINEMIKIFIKQSELTIQKINNLLEKSINPDNAKLNLIEIRRLFHTLAGDAAIIKFTYTSTLSRKIEELINNILFKNNELEPRYINIIKESTYLIELLIKSFEKDSQILSEWAKLYKKIIIK